MSDWRRVQLGHVLTLQRGFDITRKMQRPGSVPVVSSSGISSFHDESRVDGPGVVIGRKGSLGTTYFLKEPHWPHDTTLWVKDFKGNDPYFCFLALRSLRLCELDAGSSNPTLNRNHAHLLPLVIPDVATQRRIAAVAQALDELIDINERRIELLEDLARSLYREWFVRFRYPGHVDEEFVDSELGSIPEGWQVARLGDVAGINRRTCSQTELPDPLRYLDISSVGVGRLGPPVPMGAADAPGRARRILIDGDIVWATVRPNRRAHGLVHDPPFNLIASTGLAVLSPEDVPSSFLFAHTSEPVFAEYLVGRATGSAYPAVRPSDFEQAPLVLPSEPVLRAFDERTDSGLRMCSALMHQSRLLADTRDLLFPRLVTGQLDISDVDLGDLLAVEAA